jgi:hypothetical protein
MNDLRKLTLLAGLVGICGASNVRGEMASGSFTNTFNNGVRIWDISGSYSNSVQDFAMDYTINMDQSGKFSGHGSTTMPGVTTLDLGFFGTVRNVSSNVTKVNICLRLKGSMDLGGQGLMNFRVAVNEKLEVDAATGTMVGTMGGSATVSIPALGRTVSQRLPLSDVQTSMPVGMTGNWELALNVQTNRNHYTGNGEVTLCNGRTVPVVVNGSYGAKTDISRLMIAGNTNGIVRLGLVSSVQGGQLQIQRLVGRALGQSLRSVSP